MALYADSDERQKSSPHFSFPRGVELISIYGSGICSTNCSQLQRSSLQFSLILGMHSEELRD